MKLKRLIYMFFVLIILSWAAYFTFTKFDLNVKYTRDQKIDSLHGVYVYYNGKTQNVSGRNVVNDYNLGLKYQCVEFVKRYYFDYLNHKMPDSYGHAKGFFNKNIADGRLNKQRNLI